MEFVSRTTGLLEEPTKAGETVVSAAYTRLRQDIMNGALPPGQKLRFNALTETYGAGMGTLREALQRLAAEGLVGAEERKGFRVENLSAEQLADTMSVRILLEVEGLRRSIQFGDVEWEVEVLGSFRRLESWSNAEGKRARSLDDRWQIYHREFHRALISACRSPTLMALRDTVFARQERYSRIFLSSEVHHAAALMNNMKEHRLIKDAALARDTDRAAS